MNLDDDNLFRDAMNDVTPLKDAENTRWNHSAAGKKCRLGHQNLKTKTF